MKFAVLALALGLAQSFRIKVGDEILGESYAQQHHEQGYEVTVKEFPKRSAGACRISDTAQVNYVGKFADGTIFDSNAKSNFGQPMKFVIGSGSVIPCWDNAFLHMHVGEKASISCPSNLAYGEQGS